MLYAASALQTEALACAEATQAAAACGMVNIHFVKALKSNEYDLAPEGIIFRDIRAFLQLNFNTWEVSHVVRTCNSVAHLIAALGARQNEARLLWPESVPVCLMM